MLYVLSWKSRNTPPFCIMYPPSRTAPTSYPGYYVSNLSWLSFWQALYGYRHLLLSWQCRWMITQAVSVRVHTNVHIEPYAHANIEPHSHSYASTFIGTYTNTYTHTFMYMRTYAQTHKHKSTVIRHAYTRTRLVQTYIITYIYTRAYICKC